jgi:phosphopantothenoylcysteine decarboxylase/phosphopantothenate--cysteine ligase
MNGKRILLIIGGGIAAYKSCELVRVLRRRGASVRCVVTKSGQKFVTPMTLAALSEDKVYTDLFDLKDEAEMGHIQLSRQADLLVVAPATADLMAKMAAGIADDLATTLLLATDKPVLVVPAMNVRMWDHPATRRNVATLRADGLTVLDPDEGPMACGEFGPGRLPEPEAIADAVATQLDPAAKPLAGKHALVTAGPTQEPIDPVRVIANRSSGLQGFAIAEALAKAGARVTLVAGPVSLPTPAGVNRINVETAAQMAAAVDQSLPADVAVMVAAVADWRVDAAPAKLKKEAGPPQLNWQKNPDILATLCASPQRPHLVIGFAAETEDAADQGAAKRLRKGCDWIVANNVSQDPMGGTQNRVHLIHADGTENWDRMDKAQVAQQLVQRISDAFCGN